MKFSPSALLTDQYQLTMAQGYFHRRMEEEAVFEFFVRELPPRRNFLLAAGLEQVLAFLESFHFAPEELEWLAGTGAFSNDFIAYLGRMRFTGEVHAMPEGTAFYRDEPILRVTAPLAQAQLVETRLVNLLQFQTMIASKAIRVVLAAAGKTLVDFGMRRAHGAEAGLLAARAAFLAGFTGTSNVLAGRVFGIPVFGTMAHSFVEAHDDELTAFQSFAEANPGNVVLLLDTYDTEKAAETVVSLAPVLKKKGIMIKGVRLDSGDLIQHALTVRRILNIGGLTDVRVLASGGLDEYELQRIVSAGAQIDGFGVGTHLDVSSDAPCLDCAYKLQEYAGRPRRKLSEDKATWPGRKQVFREYHTDGRMSGDTITLESDVSPGEPLLRPVMRAGRVLSAPETLEQIRARVVRSIRQLPEFFTALDHEPSYPVEISEALMTLRDKMAGQGR